MLAAVVWTTAAELLTAESQPQLNTHTQTLAIHRQQLTSGQEINALL